MVFAWRLDLLCGRARADSGGLRADLLRRAGGHHAVQGFEAAPRPTPARDFLVPPGVRVQRRSPDLADPESLGAAEELDLVLEDDASAGDAAKAPEELLGDVPGSGGEGAPDQEGQELGAEPEVQDGRKGWGGWIEEQGGNELEEDSTHGSEPSPPSGAALDDGEPSR